MIQFIFSHIWMAILAILFVLGEFAFWWSAIDNYKRYGKIDEVVTLIVFHSVVIGIASFFYWLILPLPIAE